MHRTWARGAVATVVLAVALRVAYGRGTLGYDAAWALVWGQELSHGALPALDVPGAPTPHPLAIAVSAVLAPFGTLGIELVLALSWLALGALGWLAFRLGHALYSPWVGALFAALLLTRPLLVVETGQALIDIPFLALVVAAMLVEARRPRTGWTVPALLALAGLLRPEAWLLAIAWAAWAAPARRDRAALAAAALAAPLVWMALDLAATGDPLHSLHETQALAAQLERPRELETALSSTPEYLRAALTTPVVWLGLAGCAAAFVGLYERTLLAAAVAGLGLAAFLVLGVAGLPLLSRYLLLPAMLLALWCAVAALGFTVAGVQSRWWIAAGALALGLLVAGLPSLRGELRDARAGVDSRREIEQALTAVLSEPPVRAALARCGGAPTVPDDRPRPLAAYVTGARGIAVQGARAPRPGVTVNYAAAAPREIYRIGPAPPPGLPAGSRRLAANATWIVGARC